MSVGMTFLGKQPVEMGETFSTNVSRPRWRGQYFNGVYSKILLPSKALTQRHLALLFNVARARIVYIQYVLRTNSHMNEHVHLFTIIMPGVTNYLSICLFVQTCSPMGKLESLWGNWNQHCPCFCAQSGFCVIPLD